MSEPGAPSPEPDSPSPWWLGSGSSREPAGSGHGVEELADATLVRPFFVTGGRTRPLRDGLRIHTMLTAAPAALRAPLRFEHQRIVEFCQVPRSVAEAASALGIPVGVARVLIADLANDGYLACHDHNEEELPIDVIERVRDRVRSL